MAGNMRESMDSGYEYSTTKLLQKKISTSNSATKYKRPSTSTGFRTTKQSIDYPNPKSYLEITL